jgi:hypothetical protein
LDGVDKPALPLQPMSQLLRLVISTPHRFHAGNETEDRPTDLVTLEIPEYLMAVLDGGDIMQRGMEEPVDVIAGMPGGHRSDDLVKV